jgi:hypothetical protein
VEAKAPEPEPEAPAAAGGGSREAGGAPATGGAPHFDGGSASFGDCEGPLGSVRYSVASGTFEGMLTVELGHDFPRGEIHYTTDRTLPTKDSPLYLGPIGITSTTDLRARVFIDGVATGMASGAVYVARDFDATHDLPVIVLDSYGVPPNQSVVVGGAGGGPGTGEMVVREFVDAALLSYEPGEGPTSLSSLPALATSAATHIRGQSSAFYDKKPYRLELRNPDRSDRDCVLLGMPSESDWVLNSPFPDKALIRNAFVYSLGREMGLSAPRAVFAEVYVNESARPLSSSDYQGVYLIVETIKNQKDRLDLAELGPNDTEPPAVAGGYIFKFEWQVTAIEQLLPCPMTRQNCWNWLEVVDPNPLVPAQRDYLTEYLGRAVDVFQADAPADPRTGYPSLFDTDSLIDHVVINEFTRNLDAYTRSQFFYKDREGKLVAGPLWDFDLIAGVGSDPSTGGFQFDINAARMRETVNWFSMLIQDTAFRAKLIARWKDLRRGLLSDHAIASRIDHLSAPLARAAERNFKKWNILSTQKVIFFLTPDVPTWSGQVDFMREWLLERAGFLDTQWG